MTPMGSLSVYWLIGRPQRLAGRRYCLSRVSDSAMASIWRWLSDCESVFETQYTALRVFHATSRSRRPS